MALEKLDIEIPAQFKGGKVPLEFLFRRRYSDFRKTQTMKRIECEHNTPIEDLLAWLREIEGRSMSSISEILKISRSTVGRWIKAIKIEPQKVRKAS